MNPYRDPICYENENRVAFRPPVGHETCPGCGQGIRITNGGRIKTHFIAGGRVCPMTLKVWEPTNEKEG